MERVLVLIGYFSGERMCIRQDILRQNSMIKGNMIPAAVTIGFYFA